ncbi:CRP-like cAMP-binding protein [Methylobacterium sp. BE186]|uniref:Crp/Fnr family transcriptional regulator n=1 Tax=Methylobacterium sp. BE186 TaxID=2817715 RepID=UPI00285454C2|nr:Crp/Fnr family transcriptional regulator [Methylobacterium sp. BE186]MDR7037797.1 CRP-like cAMP-binding protein [Methylobacterium sp. BE186]
MAPASDTDLIPLIRKLESIAQISDAERQAILSLPANIRLCEPRQDIVCDKDQPSHCCLVLSGWVCRYKLLTEGKRQILSFHIPGDLPDLQSLQLAVMDHSLANVTACRLAFIPHENMRELVVRFPNLGAALWRDTLVDAAIFREWMTGIGRRTAQARIAHLFCEMYLKLQAVGLARSYRCELPLTQSDIADALGLTNVHVNRSLKALRGQELITTRGRELVIHDWPGLTKAAEFDPTYLHLGPRAA